MEVVWHDDERIEEDAGTDDRGFHPFISNDLSACVEMHLIVNNLPKQHLTLIRAERDEIRAHLPVIICR
ncbi:MAG: hypothetical protein ACYDAR_15005 [Thermomicrobiales bacterium]